MRREICAVVTKGTLTEGETFLTNPDASYIMAMTESCQVSANEQGVHIFGICAVDVATSKIILGQVGLEHLISEHLKSLISLYIFVLYPKLRLLWFSAIYISCTFSRNRPVKFHLVGLIYGSFEQFRDDADCSSLCCLLSELRPVEIIKPAKLLCTETEKALFRHTRNPLVNELVPFSEFWNAEKTISEVTSIYQRRGDHSHHSSENETIVQSSDSSMTNGGGNCLPDVLSNLISEGENGSQALSALGATLFYLRQAFLDESLLRFAKFELLTCSGFGGIGQKPYMVLDAAALENLEIFENSRNGEPSG